jgi:signal transduction histidine kinase
MFSMRNFSIPKKLTWMNMLTSGTALLLAGAGLFAYDLYSFRVRTVLDLGIQAEIIGSNSISAVMFDDPRSAETTLSALQAAPHVMSAVIYTPDGYAFAGYRRDRRESPPAPPLIPGGQTQVYLFHSGQVSLVRLITFQGKSIGTVYMRSDLGAMHDREKTFAIIVTAVFLMSLLAAMWMSSSARRSIAGPIVRLAETAQSVLSKRDYSVRAPTNGERNEIAVLISSFNEMLAQIQERDAAVLEARDHLEQQVHERTGQLDAANKELEAFSYSVAHDLRAPLRHINGFAKILYDRYNTTLDAPAQDYLKLIQDGAKHMGQMVDDLLKMGQIGRQQLVCRSTDLNSVVARVLQDLQPECEGRQIDWRIGELPSVDCDKGLMRQVFANLLTNAVKYTRPREKAVIEVGQVALEGAPAIFIRDNGAGFDQQFAHKLFGVFQRLHSAEEFEGTGVGLAIVQRIVQKHGGRIWAEAEVDKGATFFIALAVSQGSVNATKSAAAGGL